MRGCWRLVRRTNIRGKQAVALAERVAKQPGNDRPEILDTLAAAYAEAGDFTKAVQTAEAGLTNAREQNKAKLAAEIQQRLELYRQKKPYRDEPAN